MHDWLLGLAGGLMIGTAGAIFLLGNGRIMGASGLLGGLLERHASFRGERLAFLAGLIGTPALILALFDLELSTRATQNLPLLIAAGLLVGFGTRLGNGCTSGHGVCGISRLSVRGIVATCTFIAVGVGTVAVLRATGGMG
jgi:uncharacterized membrane protein YedE/YeeE